MELGRAAAAQLIYDFDFKEWAERQELRDPFEYERKKNIKLLIMLMEIWKYIY